MIESLELKEIESLKAENLNRKVLRSQLPSLTSTEQHLSRECFAQVSKK